MEVRMLRTSNQAAWRRGLPAAALVAALALPTWGQPAGSRRDLVEDGSAPGLFLVYTGDVIGYIEPCG
jgi:hypothetical protein